MAIGYKQAVAAMRAGDFLMVTHGDPRKPDEATVYGLVNCGKRVDARAYRKMQGNLAAHGDGLFGAEISQTYRWVDQPVAQS